MGKYRLRHEGRDHDLGTGEFTIGRSSECALPLDDGLVSRKHAVIEVSEESIVIRDLSSRNGVRVNDRKLTGPQSLQHLDRVSIGGQVLLIIEQRDRDAVNTLQMVSCWKCGSYGSGLDPCESCGAAPEAPKGGPSFSFATSPDEQTVSLGAFRLIAPIAEKSLRMRRFEEATRLLEPTMNKILEAVDEGEELKDWRKGVEIALQLADGPQGARWLEWTLVVLRHTEEIPEASWIESMHELVRKTGYKNAAGLREYIAAISSKRLGVSERFLVRRLEALERVMLA